MAGRSDYSAFVAALHENRRIWTLFATSVAQNDNGLPPELRARIFYLAEFNRPHDEEGHCVAKTTGVVLIEIKCRGPPRLGHGEGA